MTSLIVLSIVGCAAVVVLLACLKGFSGARRYKKVEGVFVNVDESKGRLPRRRNSGLIGFPQRQTHLSKEPVSYQVCGSTAALVEMAIILGSRNLGGPVAAGQSDPRRSRLRRNPRASGRQIVNDPQPRVQPLDNS